MCLKTIDNVLHYMSHNKTLPNQWKPFYGCTSTSCHMTRHWPISTLLNLLFSYIGHMMKRWLITIIYMIYIIMSHDYDSYLCYMTSYTDLVHLLQCVLFVGRHYSSAVVNGYVYVWVDHVMHLNQWILFVWYYSLHSVWYGSVQYSVGFRVMILCMGSDWILMCVCARARVCVLARGSCDTYEWCPWPYTCLRNCIKVMCTQYHLKYVWYWFIYV
jgi:hypothetical protein